VTGGVISSATERPHSTQNSAPGCNADPQYRQFTSAPSGGAAVDARRHPRANAPR
jgi:hypothetical protein